jgi:hypothetical protein
VLLICVVCRWCKAVFYVCRHCWRGQAYCSAACRLCARKTSHRKAQRRYRQSAKGRRAHRLAENRRRRRKNQATLKNLDDQASTLSISVGMLTEKSASFLSATAASCHFCGRWGVVVSQFSRRPYGKPAYLETYDEKTVYR